ncbi:unnamed protein product [Allacma fusca]|uniref:Uncharacterized protein n=1 Tax=Allacma fusca TaxID=39272 RepID=A0A8J2L9M3_9HEXA|nr:unnamed protein product [Allacma fusca]
MTRRSEVTYQIRDTFASSSSSTPATSPHPSPIHFVEGRNGWAPSSCSSSGSFFFQHRSRNLLIISTLRHPYLKCYMVKVHKKK